MKRILFLIVFLVNLNASSVFSSPNKEILHLMDEPVSMFDWGLYQIRDGFESFIVTWGAESSLNSNPIVTVEYSWDENLIFLNVLFIETQFKQFSDKNDFGKSFVRNFSKNFNGVEQIGGVLKNFMIDAFKHRGYSSLRQDNIDYEKVVDRFRLRVRTVFPATESNGDLFDISMVCKFDGSGFMVSESSD